MQLTKIKNTSINLSEISFDEILQPEHEWEEKDTTVSSTRLDVVLKEIYQMSRQKAQDFIKKEAVKVNYRIVNDSSFNVEPGDLISLKKKGRSKVIDILGETKKQKYIMRVAKLK
ncbi:S4 domain-containing protein [Piscibacillus salipiscarius]